MKIIVTGAAGFIGRHLVSFLSKEHTVIGVDICTQPDSLKKTNIKWKELSFIDKDELARHFENVDVLIHLATTMFPIEANVSITKDIEENVIGSYRLFELAYERGCKKIIFASSAGMLYSSSFNQHTDETSLVQPTSAYGISKFAIENYGKLLSRKFGKKFITLRISNPFSNVEKSSKENHGVIPIFMERIQRGDEVTIWDRNSVKDYVFIDDIIQAFGSSVAYSGTYDTFNICSGVSTPILDLVKIIEKVTNRKARIRLEQNDYPVNNIGVISNELARRELKFSPGIDIYDVLTR